MSSYKISCTEGGRKHRWSEELKQSCLDCAKPRPRPRGFAAMPPERVREIAAMGGRKSHQLGVAYQWSSTEAAEAGRRGGALIAQDREHMARIGKAGGERSKLNRQARRRDD